MGEAIKKDNTSLEGFEEFWESPEPQSVDSITKQIQSILKVLVDDRIALNKEHQIVDQLKQHIQSLEGQVQKLSWQLGQREKELSNLYTDHHQTKMRNESLEKQVKDNKELTKENKEIRRLAHELSNHILQEKAKNEQLVEILKQFSNPELLKISKRLGLK